MISQNKVINKKKILIISNNSLSSTKNNGKTLASFFSDFPSENIAQLYFNNEIPDGTKVSKFYKITDYDMIKSIYSKNNNGKIISKLNQSTSSSNNFLTKKRSSLKKYQTFRLTRELIWKLGHWDSEKLNNWLSKFNPDLIFFCGGDSGFAYDIALSIKERFNSKLVFYVTDDYILPRKTINVFSHMRRKFIRSKMQNIINECDLFITISDKMKNIYKDIFGKNSLVLSNISDSMKVKKLFPDDNKKTEFIYAGGLHLKRHNVLHLLAKSIKKYNNKHKHCAFLKIYSTNEPEKSIKDKLNIKNASKFMGSLNSNQLKKALNNSNILVHVESFDDKSIEATRLSISTKIPEYLSLEKPILAIGPEEVASLEYLKNSAYCINNKNKIYEGIEKLINDKEIQDDLSRKAITKYNNNHNKKILINKFKKELNNIFG